MHPRHKQTSVRRSLAALHEDKERRLSPLNEPVASLNLAMIFPYDFRYGHPLIVDPVVWSIFIMFGELECNR